MKEAPPRIDSETHSDTAIHCSMNRKRDADYVLINHGENHQDAEIAHLVGEYVLSALKLASVAEAETLLCQDAKSFRLSLPIEVKTLIGL